MTFGSTFRGMDHMQFDVLPLGADAPTAVAIAVVHLYLYPSCTGVKWYFLLCTL